MATGGEIVLDEKFISLLAQADKNIKAITGSTESAEKSMVKWLSKLNSMGLDSFTKHLENIRDKYLSMSTALEKNNAFKTLASNCLNAADATQKLIDNLSKANGTNVNNTFKQTATSVKDLNTALASPAKSTGGFSSIEQEMKKTMDRIVLLKNELTTFKQLEGNSKNILNTSDYANIGKVSDELNKLMQRYKTLDSTLKGLKSQDVFKTHMDNLNGASLAAQKQKSELNKLNEAYRNGTSELQKKAKIEDAAAKKELANTKIREQAQKRLADSKALADRALNYTKGMYSPQGVLSVNNMQKAIQQMQTAQRGLNRNTEEGRKKYSELQRNIDKVKKDLDKATDSSKKFGQQGQKLSSIFSQLKTQLTAVFGLAAIKGYLQQLVNIRKEFERQQVALAGILQSKDEADKLWGQTVKLALKSPFSVKELITYTKQLSAYRIETDKLHDTTKRLADVSAGLGVDMSRLILAYGQVRAAEYLRGTELRQFTEAGIPMLEELAKYFTELEGKTISTAKVFDMISKRMVEFKDVEAVINRMTDEGGIFFQMQEQQSKTLYGELANLKDAYQLMLNDIGKGHQGTMTEAIRVIRHLINNWYDLIPVITSVGLGLTTGVLGAGIISAIKGFSNLRRTINLTALSLKSLNKISFSGWMALISILATIGVYLYEIATRTDEITAAMQALNKEIQDEMTDSIQAYKQLAKESQDLSKSYSEREKALDRLKRKYEEILPDEYLEVDYIRQMSNGYIEAENALKNYYNEKAIKQKQSKVEEKYANAFDVDTSDLTKEILESAVKRINKDGKALDFLDKSFSDKFGITEKHVHQIIAKLIEDIKSGERAIEDFSTKTIISEIEKFYEIDLSNYRLFNMSYLERNIKQIKNTLNDYAEDIDKVSGLPFATKTEEDFFYAKKKYNEQLEKEKELVNELSSAYTNYYNTTKIKTKTEQEKTDKATALSGIASDISNLYTQLGVKQVDIIPRIAEDANFVITPEIDRVSKFIHERMQKKISELSKDNPLLGNLTDEIKNSIEKLDDTDFEKSSNKLIQAVANHYKVPLRYFDKIKGDSKSTRESMLKDIETTLEANNAVINAFVQGVETAKKTINVYSEGGFDNYMATIQQVHATTEEEVERLKIVNIALTTVAQLLGQTSKKTTQKEGKSSIDSLKEAINLVKDAHKDYKDLSKTLTHIDAKGLALAKNAEAFKEAVKGIPSLASFELDAFEFDKEGGAIDSLKKLKELIPETTKNYKALMVAIEKAIGDLNGEAQVELKVKQDEALINSIEEMFDGYELSLELDKLGLPKHLMADLFNVNVFDLSEIRDKISSEISDAETKGGQEDRLKELRELLKKVDDMEEKATQERFKKYSKYLLKSQSEAVKIKLEEMRQIAEIESLPTSAANKSVMMQGVQKETQEKLDKAAWDSFKDSDMYIRMFEDLESQSTRSINRMREELENYRTSLNDLDPASLKEIASRLDALDEQIAKRNPFKGLAESYKSFAKIQAKYGSEKNLELYLNKSREEESLLQKEIDSQHLVKQEAEERVNDAIIKGDVLQIALAKSLLNIEEFKLNTLLKQLVAQKKITQEQADDLRKLQKSKKMFSGSMADIGSDISEVTSALPTIMSDMESMGVNFSDSMKDTVESVAEIGSGIGNAIQGFASGNYVQGVLGVTQAIAGVFKIGDKKKEREIKGLIEKVEELGRAYEKLQKQIENAYSLDQFRAGYAQSKENLEQQIQATEDMIATEEAKKNTDNERIKEWQNNIEEYKEQLKELEDQRLQELGGFGESGIKSAADDFVDAWLTAYQETGDGLDALEDKWDEYIRNIIKKQMALRVADKVIAPITKEVDEALYDSALTDDELAEIEKMTEEKSKEFNQMMHQLANYFGSATDALKENVELSGLTQGIQGVTEQTADQLAGLVNSIRLYSANNNATLIRIADAMEQNKPQTENPMVAQLRQLVMHTESIYDLLNNLTIDGGKSIHVKM